MIFDFLNTLNDNKFNEVIFFLKDFIYHSAHDNYLTIPKSVSEDLSPENLIKIEILLAAIRNEDSKQLLLEDINSIIYKKNEPSKNTIKKASEILKELSSSEIKETTDKITVEWSDSIKGVTEPLSYLSNPKYGRQKNINMRKLIRRRDLLKLKGFRHPFTVRASQENDVILREITLNNGVTVKIVVDEKNFDKFNYQQPIVTNSILDLLIKETSGL
tara:strand:- start:11609 stop:12259 length:651 start_codon:yes stop_codon:yes gene_type:complete